MITGGKGLFRLQKITNVNFFSCRAAVAEFSESVIGRTIERLDLKPNCCGKIRFLSLR
jgi:hypothetical protein